MKKQRLGFTILEVVLVLAISSLLFIGIVFSLSQRIAYGRYNNATNELADFLKDTFSSVLNTENARFGNELSREYCSLSGATASGNFANGRPVMSGVNSTSTPTEPYAYYPGRTNCAIYGKILFFGTTGLNDASSADDKIYVFDIVGDTVEQNNMSSILATEKNSGIIAALKAVHADYSAAIFENSNDPNSGCKVAPAGSFRTYSPSWGTLLKTANYNSPSGLDINDNFEGMVMIVRAPASGEVATFFYEGSYDSSEIPQMATDDGMLDIGCNNLSSGNVSSYTLDYQKFEDYTPTYDNGEEKNEGFCISSDDFWVAIGNLRKYIRFIRNGQNPSAIDLDQSEENPCRRR